MNDTFEKHILHKVFLEKAEKAETLEQKILFCESFLKKYKKSENPVFSSIYQQEYEMTFKNTSSYITRNPSEVLHVQKSYSQNILENLPQEKAEMERMIKQELIHELMKELDNKRYLDINTRLEPDMYSTTMSCKLGVFKA